MPEGIPPPPPEEENPDQDKPSQLPVVAEARNVIPHTFKPEKKGPTTELVRKEPEIIRPVWTEVPREDTREQARRTEELITETRERLRRNEEEDRLRRERRSIEARKEPEGKELVRVSSAEKPKDKDPEVIRPDWKEVPQNESKKSKGSKNTFGKIFDSKYIKRGVGGIAAVGVTAAGIGIGAWAGGFIGSEIGFTGPVLSGLTAGTGLAGFLGPIIGAVGIDYLTIQLIKSLSEDWRSLLNDYVGWLGVKTSGGGGARPARRQAPAGGGGAAHH